MDNLLLKDTKNSRYDIKRFTVKYCVLDTVKLFHHYQGKVLVLIPYKLIELALSIP